ncbi:helix-turn-helix transcriptional regulator [Natrarchaeobius oligotrophus]|uniref:HTH iclR-type domain-containing protein n=1 Tax=Natrarchaeobius chitinivorans TaxID=1679083 RepID=A0A3N6MGF5_NATCH|nr:hypothetical protein [Natrarchaeobius chitinivorans]RQH00075.1 hypothetical protein EA472_12760 [Natrarchaeobius chitinivorans]
MNRSVSVGFVVLVVAISVAGISSPAVVSPAEPVAVSDTHQTTESVAASTSSISQNDVDSSDFDTTTFEIVVHENGSATWTFRHERRLGDGDEDEDEARANFLEFAEEFESEESEAGLYQRFTDQAEALTDRGSETTGREMEATHFNRSASVDEQLNAMGVVEMSFVWKNFAATEENGPVVVGDVFQDLYITNDQSILIVAGDGLTFQSADPEPQYVGTSLEHADSVQWSGEREFLDGHPRVVLEQSEADGDGGDSTSLSEMANDDGSLSSTLLAVAFGALILTVVGVGALWYRTRESPPESRSHDAPKRTAAEGTTSPDAESSAEPAAGTDDDGAFPDEELLTDEDRVVNLIRENGGRMKQVNIVEETGWSKSKVSMLLSDMEDDGTISKLRVGRENIISLEGFEPEATKSPFEE